MASNYTYNQPDYTTGSITNTRPEYIPEGYSIPLPRKSESNDYLASPHPRTQPEQESSAFQPVAPDQYRPPDTRGVPPAQLPPYDQHVILPPVDEYRSPSHPPRRDRSRSRHSTRSHTSTRSRHTHHSDHHSDRERHRHEQKRLRHSDRDAEEGRRRRQRGEDDLADEAPLKRKNTFRGGFGTTIFSLYEGIKHSLTK